MRNGQYGRQSGPRVLVTGGSGFVGRPTVAALQAAGAEVHVLGRHPAPGAAWRECDILDGDVGPHLGAVRPEIVLHLAWTVEPGAFWTDPRNPAWADATVALAAAAADAGARRFIGVGTCWEYDWPGDGDCVEGRTPLASHTPYDLAKADSRDRLERLLAQRGLSFAWARLFFLFGAGENPRRLLPSVASALMRGEPARCTGGTVVRDFIDVAQAGRALAALALSEVQGPVNIASGVGWTVADIVTRLGVLAGRPDLVALGALPDRPDEPPRVVADTGRLREEVGFDPRAPDDDALRAVLAQWAGSGLISRASAP